MPISNRARVAGARARARFSRRKQVAKLRFPMRPSRGRRSKYGFPTQTHHFIRWVEYFNAVTSSTGIAYDTTGNNLTITGNGSLKEFDNGFAFQINDLQSITELSNLYDQYRIDGVKFYIKMTSNPDAQYMPNGTQYGGSNNNSAGNFYPTLWFVRDHDDNAASNVATLKQYTKAKHVVLKPNKEIGIFVKPSTLTEVKTASGGSSNLVNYGKPWLDIADLNVNYYGLKMAIDFEGLTVPNTMTWTFHVTAKYYVSMKNPR